MTIDTKQLNYILETTPATQNIMLVGKHGIGKSRILEDYFKAKGQKVVILFLGQMSDPGDLIGLPEKDEKTGKTDFMLPYWFPVDGKPIVLFLDELNRARPEVLQTIMDLTLNRKLAGKSLPEGSRIISAVNNGNEYQLTDLDPALISRFNIYEFVPSVEDWITWAKTSGIDSRIIDFINENPEYLDSSDLETEENSFERSPDRRSWERASEIIKNISELSDLQKPVISGILGNRVTSIFFRFIMGKKTLSAKMILEGKFKEHKSELKALSIPELTTLNKQIFHFAETEVVNSNYPFNYLNNMKSYFDFLGKEGLKEIQAHFTSLCSAENYPNTLNLITEHMPEFYKVIIESC